MGIINNFNTYLAMINLSFMAGQLVNQAISEVKSSHRKMSMAEVLIGAGVVGSDSALS